MKPNLKTLGLVLVSVFAMSALVAQGASASVEHEFHFDGERTVLTGHGENHEITFGSKGIVKCTTVQTESTATSTLVSADTYRTDQITVIPHYSGCSFGGVAATVNFHHCGTVFDSDTTFGNTTGGEHANWELECEGPEGKVTIATSTCTITVSPQAINDAIRYENDTTTSIKIVTTAHETAIGNLNDKAGCVLFPKGKVAKYIGTTTATCYRDDGTPRTGTEKTTPTETTVEGPTTDCTVT